MSAHSVSPIALAEGREIMFSIVMDMSDWAASHARSAAEAAWRGEAEALGVHLREARCALVAALRSYNEIVAESADARAA